MEELPSSYLKKTALRDSQRPELAQENTKEMSI